MKMTCKITFKESKNNRYVKGNEYEVLPMIGEPKLKLFRIYNENGTSFATDENHVNKFFK